MMCDAVSGCYYIPHAAQHKRSYCPLFILSGPLFLLPGICSAGRHAGRRALLAVAINENVQFKLVVVMLSTNIKRPHWHHVIRLLQTSQHIQTRKISPTNILSILRPSG